MFKTGDLERIQKRIESFNREAVFVASDFTDLALPDSVWQTLSRLERTGAIRRVFRGVYYKPVFSSFLGEYESPSPQNVALALARKFNWTIAPSGNTALNLLGLSTQVSAKWSYISDGPYNRFEFDGITIEFKHRSNRFISGYSYKSALVIQALKELGKENVCDSDLEKIGALLSVEEKETLRAESRKTTAWVYSHIKRICLQEMEPCTR